MQSTYGVNKALLILKSAHIVFCNFSKNVFLIFRYKQSHSGNDAETNTVAECTITAPTERERLAGGKEGERSEVREKADRGSARMSRVEDLWG